MVKIKSSTHAPFRFPRLLSNTKQLRYDIKFTNSCRYDIGEDQTDINKLFGIGYFPSHHKNSVRFGWRYNPTIDKIEILAYYYKNSSRQWNDICSVDIGVSYRYVLSIRDGIHYLEVVGMSNRIAVDVKSRKLGYLLSLYFGGNREAPHDMYVDMNRV